jgi:hypothetical protein
VHTPLLVDLHLGVEVDAGDEQVADDVERAHAHEDVGVFKGDLLADLHHDKDDHEVGAAICYPLVSLRCSMLDSRHIEFARLDWRHTFEGSWWAVVESGVGGVVACVVVEMGVGREVEGGKSFAKGQAIKSRDRGATWWFLLAGVLLGGDWTELGGTGSGRGSNCLEDLESSNPCR